MATRSPALTASPPRLRRAARRGAGNRGLPVGRGTGTSFLVGISVSFRLTEMRAMDARNLGQVFPGPKVSFASSPRWRTEPEGWCVDLSPAVFLVGGNYSPYIGPTLRPWISAFKRKRHERQLGLGWRSDAAFFGWPLDSRPARLISGAWPPAVWVRPRSVFTIRGENAVRWRRSLGGPSSSRVRPRRWPMPGGEVF